eukprot:gene15710-15498_t
MTECTPPGGVTSVVPDGDSGFAARSPVGAWAVWGLHRSLDAVVRTPPMPNETQLVLQERNGGAAAGGGIVRPLRPAGSIASKLWVGHSAPLPAAATQSNDAVSFAYSPYPAPAEVWGDIFGMCAVAAARCMGVTAAASSYEAVAA